MAVNDANVEVNNGGNEMNGGGEDRDTSVGLEKGMANVRADEFPTLNEVFLTASSSIQHTTKNTTINDCDKETASVNNTTQCLVEEVNECVSEGNEDNGLKTSTQNKHMNNTFASTVMKELVNLDNGREVIFEEESVIEGSMKWMLTLCGRFVGFRMSYQEIKYNLSRMWGKYSLKDIIMQNGIYMFKFKDEIGMNFVLDNGPWMVNSKPLFVQKWDPSIIIDRTDPKMLSMWIKLCNMPLEAWSVKGVSAVASGVGNPLIMDKMTTNVCHEGAGRLGYARVLVKVSADRELKDKVEICYKNGKNEVKCSKFVNVEYDWKPPVCSHCSVFGHTLSKCTERPREVGDENGNRGDKVRNNNDKEGFVEVVEKGAKSITRNN